MRSNKISISLFNLVNQFPKLSDKRAQYSNGFTIYKNTNNTID